jgi:hypothetical protein
MDRRIRAVKKNQNGNITAVCNPGESWSPRRVADVARDIKSWRKSYYVHERGRRTYVRLLPNGVLQTTEDSKNGNNLNNLPLA